MKKFNMAEAIKWYNRIMNSIGYEHKTIGEPLSEDTENWNLRDMVAEADYILSCYFENGHILGDMRYGDEDERRIWRNETARLKRFIEVYSKYIEGMTCTEGHCSGKYDNHVHDKPAIRLRNN